MAGVSITEEQVRNALLAELGNMTQRAVVAEALLDAYQKRVEELENEVDKPAYVPGDR